jgi:hypothetical protein
LELYTLCHYLLKCNLPFEMGPLSKDLIGFSDRGAHVLWALSTTTVGDCSPYEQKDVITHHGHRVKSKTFEKLNYATIF